MLTSLENWISSTISFFSGYVQRAACSQQEARLHSISRKLTKFRQRGREERYIEVIRCKVTLITRNQHYDHHVTIIPHNCDYG